METHNSSVHVDESSDSGFISFSISCGCSENFNYYKNILAYSSTVELDSLQPSEERVENVPNESYLMDSIAYESRTPVKETIW